jgi:hypothetical protein
VAVRLREDEIDRGRVLQTTSSMTVIAVFANSMGGKPVGEDAVEGFV